MLVSRFYFGEVYCYLMGQIWQGRKESMQGHIVTLCSELYTWDIYMYSHSIIFDIVYLLYRHGEPCKEEKKNQEESSYWIPSPPTDSWTCWLLPSSTAATTEFTASSVEQSPGCTARWRRLLYIYCEYVRQWRKRGWGKGEIESVYSYGNSWR